MSAALILDCSVTMAWCFQEEQTLATSEVRDRLNREVALAPALWVLEVANVLWLAEERGRITRQLANEFVDILKKMKIEIDHAAAARAFEHVLPLCRHHHLTAYDAAYLELALRTGLPIATLDSRLRSAATDHGVPLLGK